MTWYLKKSITEIGESPYEIKFRVKKKADQVLSRVIDFDSEVITEKRLDTIEGIDQYKNTDTVTWLNVDGLHNLELLEEICSNYDLDRIIASETLNTSQWPIYSWYI